MENLFGTDVVYIKIRIAAYQNLAVLLRVNADQAEQALTLIRACDQTWKESSDRLSNLYEDITDYIDATLSADLIVHQFINPDQEVTILDI